MTPTHTIINGHATAESRWARLGPYYAMFPLDFTFKVINKYSKKGDYIIDPFAGRCSTVFAGNILKRNSLGIEINPVGWLYGKVKLQPATKENVLIRLTDIYNKRNHYVNASKNINDFFRFCFCEEVLKFLIACRKNLDWQNNNVDATLMAIILVYLHGKIGESLSNQMKMTKAMSIPYSIQWWKKHGFRTPPEINPYNFLKTKIEWRYAKGAPKTLTDSHVILGDSTIKLTNVVKQNKRKFALLFTSPPYCAVTNYHVDQWLRLWMLGGQETTQSPKEKYKGRFNNKQEYYTLLDSVFGLCSKIMKVNSIIYVRTDIRKFTRETTEQILEKYFPKHKKMTFVHKVNKRTQTDVIGNISSEKGEVDIILSRY
ncbi:MAG: site-specific DNA-methyltransferase [Bacteroidales bacterium]|jgi:DNA modification methylase|nr:site-specific DNA-methyltransferase [Bacteroidales bacterium]